MNKMLNLNNPTRNDVEAAIRAYSGITSKAAAIALMQKHGGADALADLEPSRFAAVIQAAITATASAASGNASAKGNATQPKKAITPEDVRKIYSRWNNPPKMEASRE